MTAAEINQLKTTPKQAVAAPGSGIIACPMIMIGKNKFNTTAFVGGAINLAYASGGATMGSYTAAFTTAVADKLQQKTVIGADILENTALEYNVAGTDPTLGDGKIESILKYSLEKFTI